MKKTIKIKRNADIFFELAEEKLDEGSMEQAAYYFYQSYLKDPNPETLLALAETYCEMGVFKQELKYLFLALDKEPDNIDVCRALADCFLRMDDDDTAFFYLTPGMTIKKFNYVLGESVRLEQMESPRIRVIEKNDEMVLAVAVKLLESGDNVYAAEMLKTIKPDSPQYINASNILALQAIESGNAKDAQKYVARALKKKDTIFTRCNQLLIAHKLGDDKKKQQITQIIEAKRLDEEECRTVALTYLRILDSAHAQKHFLSILNYQPFDRDAMVSYALCKYREGDIQAAKNEIFNAHRAYPFDVAIKQILADIYKGRDLGLFPFLSDKKAQEWLKEIDFLLEGIKDNDSDLASNKGFCKKIEWLYQSKFTSKQNKASLILAKKKGWHSFLKNQLLNNDWEMSAKKVCLHALLLNTDGGRLGIVLDGLYARLRVSYPEGMDTVFRAAYCLAFSSFTFCDSCFEDRLFGAAVRLLKKYNAQDFDKGKIINEQALAAALFYSAKHKKIVSAKQCGHVFGCEESAVKECISLLKG